MIQPLNYLEVVGIIEEIPTDGHCPLLIIADDFNQYYIKNNRGLIPDYNIINEFLCHFLLRLWEIPTPDIAGIWLDPSILYEGLSVYHKSQYYQSITFGSKSILDSFELNSFIETKGKVDLRKLNNPEVLIKLGLFDIWVENTDRKPTNNNILLALNSKGIDIIAIDHAFTFDSLAYKDLFLGITNTYNQSIMYTDFAKSIIENKYKHKHEIETIREYFYLCINKCQQSFNEIVNNIPEELGFTVLLQDAIKNFLFDENRNKQVFEEFITRL